ncbi:MAG: hypothetical protein CBB68_00665 [Rhodospirillaceae bacterium TMED8]|nr:hypothetical protein [Magnetovibrio sp.]OUT53199.1 MAG: hypothetical protein CBB68_00665 [Rhodospirillaceae bacterium TMED8]
MLQVFRHPVLFFHSRYATVVGCWNAQDESTEDMTIEIEWRDYDVVVVGSGGAGSAAADAAANAGARVLIVSKDPIGCSDTKISEGNATVRASASDADTKQELSDNLRVSGADLPVPELTNAYAADSRHAYDWYRSHGLRPKINTDRNGPFARPLAKGGHTIGRSVGHRNAGIAFGHAGWQAVVESERIDYLEDAWFLELITESQTLEQKRVSGGVIYDAARGILIAVRAPSIVIAAGGLSTLYFPKTDTMRGNTGDSYAVAARAGAELIDMEQVQFLPFCLTSPPSYEGLLAGEPTTASFLGVLRDKHGKVILDTIYLRTRAECSAAIMRSVASGNGTDSGGAYLDLTANVRLPKSGGFYLRYLETALPSGYRNARQALGQSAIQGLQPWEVRPAAHYMMGGIRVDASGASISGHDTGAKNLELLGLFAAGQAMGGVFGANRLGSTALTENVVFGLRAGQEAARLARDTNNISDHGFAEVLGTIKQQFGQSGTAQAAPLKQQLQLAAWECIGPARSSTSLEKMHATISHISSLLHDISIPAYGQWNQAFIEFQELRNLLDVAEAITVAARERDASVGGHVRLDCNNVSIFAKPYSTVVKLGLDFDRDERRSFKVRREDRPRTPIRRLVAFRLRENWRKSQVKALKLLPKKILDSLLERRYREILGPSNTAKIIQPGSTAGAEIEANR